jgi:hypothetical protein
MDSFSLGYHFCSGQKYLQLEKLNSARTRKFSPGSEITIQLKGGQWYTRVIEDVSYEQDHIVFSYGHCKLADITSMKSFNSQKWSRPLGNQMYNFALAWTGFSLISSAVDKEDPYSKGDVIVALSSIATGFAIKKIFKQRTFHLARPNGNPGNWRLRIIDLNVKKYQKPPNSPTP